jgi:hypothetical protein
MKIPIDSEIHKMHNQRHSRALIAARKANCTFYVQEISGTYSCYGSTAQEVKTLLGNNPNWHHANIGRDVLHSIPCASCVRDKVWKAIEDLSAFGSVAIIDLRGGSVQGTWEPYAVCVVPKKGSKPVSAPVELDDATVEAWMDRSEFLGSVAEARRAIEDARTLEAAPAPVPADIDGDIDDAI